MFGKEGKHVNGLSRMDSDRAVARTSQTLTDFIEPGHLWFPEHER